MNRIVAELRASFLQRCQTSPDYDWWMNTNKQKKGINYQTYDSFFEN